LEADLCFLRCRDFVNDDTRVPEDRQSGATVALPNDTTLAASLDEILNVEMIPDSWANQAVVIVETDQLQNANRLTIPEGRTHGEDFPWDDWSDDNWNEYRQNLERWGVIDQDYTDDDLKETWEDNAFHKGRGFINHLRETIDDEEVTKDDLPSIRLLFRNWLPPICWHGPTSQRVPVPVDKRREVCLSAAPRLCPTKRCLGQCNA
jgi:hypothetical protein